MIQATNSKPSQAGTNQVGIEIDRRNRNRHAADIKVANNIAASGIVIALNRKDSRTSPVSRQ